MQSDVELTDAERRVIAEIERYERRRPLRSRVASIAYVTRRRGVSSWIATGLGVVVLMGGLVAGQPLVAFIGFVFLLRGAAQLIVRSSSPVERLRSLMNGPWPRRSAPGARSRRDMNR